MQLTPQQQAAELRQFIQARIDVARGARQGRWAVRLNPATGQPFKHKDESGGMGYSHVVDAPGFAILLGLTDSPTDHDARFIADCGTHALAGWESMLWISDAWALLLDGPVEVRKYAAAHIAALHAKLCGGAK